LLLSLASKGAEVLGPKELLPEDTIAVFSCPDWTKFQSYYRQSAYGQMWDDPAMKPFRDKFEKKFSSAIIEPLQKELGIKLTEYEALLQGQLTVAFTPPTEGSSDPVGLLILLDAKDKSELLSSKLGELKKKWSEGNRPTKTEKIRDVEFTSITITPEESKGFFKRILGGADEKGKPDEDDKDAKEPKKKDEEAKKENLQLRIGQSKSLLVIGENPKAIEKVLARQNGGLLGSLGEQAAFQKNRAASSRDAIAFAWLNWKPVYDLVLKGAEKSGQAEEGVGGMPNMKAEKILPLLGLKGLDSLGVSLSGGADGTMIDAFIAVPEAQREGLFRVFNLQAKDASPPPFVPADAVKFQRWRIDAQKSWSTLENLLNKLDPGIAAMVQSALQFAGKDKDPNFDLKKSFFGNLGDDFIVYEKLPKSAKIADMSSPPSLFLLGSPQPEQIVDSIRMLTSLLPPTMSITPPKEREFLGKKIYTLTSVGAVPDEEEADDKKGEKKKGDAAAAPPTQTFNFAAAGGYVVMSSDTAILEEYLRNGEAPVKPLREVAGLNEAAAKVGGMDKGFFGYENQKENLRHTLEVLKNDKDALDKMFSFVFVLRMNDEGDDSGKGIKEWMDYTLLPGFDQISKYFSVATYSAGENNEGFFVKGYGPTPKK
jgi:hypothetical protein